MEEEVVKLELLKQSQKLMLNQKLEVYGEVHDLQKEKELIYLQLEMKNWKGKGRERKKEMLKS